MPEVKEFYVGSEALSKRGILMIKYPIDKGTIFHWRDMEAIWHHLFHNELKISPEESSVLMTVSPQNFQNSDLERMAEIMFEKFGVPALYMEHQAVLGLFNAGKTTGIVVESGYGSTDIVPVCDGVALGGQNKKHPLGGHDLTLLLKTMMQERGYAVVDESETIPIIADMKEKLCNVTLDFEGEMNPASESSNLEKTYPFPGGDVVVLGNERFRCPESMFNNKGIHKLVRDSARPCDPSVRQELYNNVVLSGGNTLFKGFPERLQHELKNETQTRDIKVDAPLDRKYAVWLGGSILASLPSFQQKWISKRDYDEFGPSVCHKTNG